MDPTKALRAEISKLEREKERAASFALTTDDGGTFTRLIEERSRHIAALRAELVAVEADSALTQTARALTPAKLRELLFELGGAREALPAMLERVILNPDLTCQVHYRAVGCLSVASPRGFEPLLPP